MKLMIAVIAAAAVVPAAAAWAQDRQIREERVVVRVGPGEATEIPEGGLGRDAFLARQGEAFARLDTNGDGVLSRDEMAAAAGGRELSFAGMDGRDIRIVRRDGAGEAPPADGEARRIVIQRSGAGGGAPMIIDGADFESLPGGGERQVFVFRSSGEDRMDADGDGRLTFEEMAAPLRRHFERQDANGDGYLDASERAPVPPLPPMAPEPPAPPAPVY